MVWACWRLWFKLAASQLMRPVLAIGSKSGGELLVDTREGRRVVSILVSVGGENDGEGWRAQCCCKQGGAPHVLIKSRLAYVYVLGLLLWPAKWPANMALGFWRHQSRLVNHALPCCHLHLAHKCSQQINLELAERIELERNLCDKRHRSFRRA